jgi:hypothetical protein
MDFREATDSLCTKVDHTDLAKALGVSIQSVRQARLQPENEARRAPPREWEHTIIRLAEKQVWHYRKLIERLRHENKDGN